jgi:Conserved region in glutamate synthase
MQSQRCRLDLVSVHSSVACVTADFWLAQSALTVDAALYSYILWLALTDCVQTGAGIRDRVTLICSGKVLSGFSIVRNLALGADICNAARAFMFSLGCIQVSGSV